MEEKKKLAQEKYKRRLRLKSYVIKQVIIPFLELVVEDKKRQEMLKKSENIDDGEGHEKATNVTSPDKDCLSETLPKNVDQKKAKKKAKQIEKVERDTKMVSILSAAKDKK